MLTTGSMKLEKNLICLWTSVGALRCTSIEAVKIRKVLVEWMTDGCKLTGDKRRQLDILR